MRFNTMKRFTIHPLWFFGLLCGLMSSCLEDINLDTGERVLNVYCVLKQESEQVLELSFIAPTGGESRPVGDGVKITLYDGDTSVGLFTRTSETKWNLDYTPQGGHTYRLEVTVPGEETLTAETRYPSVGKLHYVNAVSSDNNGYLEGYELDCSEDLILWCYYENRRDGPVITGYIVSNHPGVDGRGETIYPWDWESPVFKKKFDNGTFMHSTSGNLPSYPNVLFGGPFFLHEKVLRILHPAGFSRPVNNEKVRIYLFRGSGEDRYPVEDKSGKTGMFSLGTMDASGSWVLNSVSTEYDKYMVDYYYVKHQSYDFTDLVYRKNHYSNIVNGAGIFGASYEYRSFSVD